MSGTAAGAGTSGVTASVKRRRGPASRASSELPPPVVDLDKVTTPRRSRRTRDVEDFGDGSQQVTHSSHQVEDPKTDGMAETAVSSPPRTGPSSARGAVGMSPPRAGNGGGGGGTRQADPSRRRLKGWGANFVSLAFKTYYRQGHSGTTGVFSLLLHPAVLFTICAVFGVLVVSSVLSWLHVRTATGRIVVSDSRATITALTDRLEELAMSSSHATKHMQLELDSITKSADEKIEARLKTLNKAMESKVESVREETRKMREETAQALKESSSVLASAMDEVKQEVKEVVEELKKDVEVVKEEVKKDVEEVKREMKRELAEVKRNVEEANKSVEKLVRDLYGNDGPLSKREVLAITKSLMDERAKEGNGRAISLEDVRMAARKIVLDELAKHAADGIGRTDYALGSGGARVVDHSAAIDPAGRGIAAGLLARVSLRKVDERASRVVEPNLGQPGHCFPLKGSTGTIDIALRTSILPDAFTLEHVAKSAAYEIGSAPKDFRVLGWDSESGKRSFDPPERKILGEFTYSVDGASIQTFNIPESDQTHEPINMIRLHVLSNHGHPNHTCVYRIRVHGTPATQRQAS